MDKNQKSIPFAERLATRHKTITFTAQLFMEQPDSSNFKPYVAAGDVSVREFTLRAVVLGALFGIIFGAATVYLALKAGLTVSVALSPTNTTRDLSIFPNPYFRLIFSTAARTGLPSGLTP